MEKKYLITAVIVIVTVIICCGLIFGSGITHEKTYEQYNFSATCSIELPTWINFNTGAGDLNSNSNVMGSNVASTTKALFGNNEVMQITYSHSTVDGANVGVDLNDNMVLEQNGKKVYTRMVMNEATGESISIMGENEEVVNYIADHVKFNGAEVNNTNKTTEATTTNTEPVTNNNDDAKNDDDIERDSRYDGRYDNRVDLNEAYNAGFSDGRQSSSEDVEYGDIETSGSSSGSGSASVETGELE
jgi:hypothetical protein